MDMRRYVGLVDLGVATVVAVAIFLPPREMYASAAIKGDDAQQFALAVAEARTISHPGDGQATEDLARKLGEAGMKDWAIEVAARGSERAKDSPTRWRALLATSVAYVDQLDVVPALEYADMALAACDTAREHGAEAACPSPDQVRMQLYQAHLDAGVKSGIDPRKGPAAAAAFRRAGESVLRQIRLVPPRQDRTGSGSSGSGSAASTGSGSGTAP
jgi:hypothetical protein